MQQEENDLHKLNYAEIVDYAKLAIMVSVNIADICKDYIKRGIEIKKHLL